MSAYRNGSHNKKSFAEVAAAANAGASGKEAIEKTPVAQNVDYLGKLLKDVSIDERPIIAKTHSDTKSVTSRTTLALDEKESLRPDDSASMQAAPEEDNLSPVGSVLAGSSDPDIRAFRDQLYEIDRTGGNKISKPVVEARNGGIIFTTPPAASPFRPALPVIPPDEKLLEALASPKDRLFVLKIEQDMIDFVKDSQEEYLQLPQTNSFYRMLSHKLADYYLLGHVIDESLTSVRIYRTPNARLPPPLIGLEPVEGRTPPTRKIMRRGAPDSSDSASKATSEAGDGSDGDTPLSKGPALTREERENRYKEARARIFKDFNEEDMQAGEKDPSRSSSAARKKQPRDDGFEARSAYSQYGGQAFIPRSPNAYFSPQQQQHQHQQQQHQYPYPQPSFPGNSYPLVDPYAGTWFGQDMYNQSTPKQTHVAMNFPAFEGYHSYPYEENMAMYPQNGYPPHMQYNMALNNAHQRRFNPQTQAFVPSFQAPGMGPMAWPQPPPQYRNRMPMPMPPPQPQPQQHQHQQQQQNKMPKQTSISKWGAPSTLPPKPPPPATSLSFQIPKNSESQQPLPPHPFSHA